MRPSFTELSRESYRGAIIILDVDGTLVPDRGEELSEEVKSAVASLQEVAEVHLCSNALPTRTRAFAEKCGVGVLVSGHKKPSRRVVEALDTRGQRMVVIGDKVVTDGLLAKNIGADFVLVRRLYGSHTSLRGRAGYVADELVRPFFSWFSALFPYLMLMRPTQWVKNLLIFTPLFFAGSAFSLPLLVASCLAFLSFSFSASALYVFNDLRDREADAQHPTKRFRPLARGTVRAKEARLLIGLLAFVSLALALFIPLILIPLGAYVVLNTLYSLYVKRIPVADVVSVSASYVLRVFVGGVATGIFVSPWLIACVFFGALILISGKRRAELVRGGNRTVLRRYSLRILDRMLLVSAGLTILSFGLYALFGGHGILVGISSLCVAGAVMRLVYLVRTSEDAEYPEALALKDPLILMLLLGWVALMYIELYTY